MKNWCDRQEKWARNACEVCGCVVGETRGLPWPWVGDMGLGGMRGEILGDHHVGDVSRCTVIAHETHDATKA